MGRSPPPLLISIKLETSKKREFSERTAAHNRRERRFFPGRRIMKQLACGIVERNDGRIRKTERFWETHQELDFGDFGRNVCS